MTLEWDSLPEDAWGDLTQVIVDAIEADIVAYIESLLDPIETWLKQNHPWQNRTGAAEAGLYTDIEHVVRESVTLLMSHGPAIDYAVFLEHARRGRYSVLRPALDAWAAEIFQGVYQIVRRYSG